MRKYEHAVLTLLKHGGDVYGGLPEGQMAATGLGSGHLSATLSRLWRRGVIASGGISYMGRYWRLVA